MHSLRDKSLDELLGVQAEAWNEIVHRFEEQQREVVLLREERDRLWSVCEWIVCMDDQDGTAPVEQPLPLGEIIDHLCKVMNNAE